MTYPYISNLPPAQPQDHFRNYRVPPAFFDGRYAQNVFSNPFLDYLHERQQVINNNIDGFANLDYARSLGNLNAPPAMAGDFPLMTNAFANVANNPNFQYAQSLLPHLDAADRTKNWALNNIAGNAGTAGSAEAASGSIAGGNSLLADVGSYAAAGAAYGMLVGWIPVVGQIGIAASTGIGAAAGALKHFLWN
jgi:hypothetical protein